MMHRITGQRTRALMVLFVFAAVVSLSAQERASAAIPVEEDTVREIVKNGTLGSLLLAVLFSYRRDFFKKDEAREAEIDRERQQHLEDKARLERLLERTGETLKEVAVQSAVKAEAINRLAAIVERLERSNA